MIKHVCSLLVTIKGCLLHHPNLTSCHSSLTQIAIAHILRAKLGIFPGSLGRARPVESAPEMITGAAALVCLFRDLT